MKLYRIPITIDATAYVKADNMKLAVERACDVLDDETLAIFDGTYIDGRTFNDPYLPEVSIAPAMTVAGIHPQHASEVHDD